MRALVLAAGKSTRIASVSGGRPKPLLEIGGASVLEHNLRLLAGHGISQVWINLHHEADQLRTAVGDGSQWGLSVSYSFEPVLLGTAGAVKKLASELSEGTFLVLYGDNFTNCRLDQLLAAHRDAQAVATIAVFDARRSRNSGIAGGTVQVDGNHMVERFVEGRPNPASSLVNAGIYALEPAVIADIPAAPADFGRDVFPALIERGGRVGAYLMDGFCLALDTPESYAEAQRVQDAIDLEATR